jgi:hypothetical protein
MTYTAEKPALTESSEQLRARIPGWGADLDPADRPAFPREQFDPEVAAVYGPIPEQQPETRPRERSIEHERLTPVFGTVCPTRGLSGVIRKYAYARYSEGRAAHWLLLMAGDRIDVLENVARSFVTLRPDNPITQTGILSEVRRHGVSSRLGHNRVDVKHQWMDPIIVGAPWALGAMAAYRLASRIRRH